MPDELKPKGSRESLSTEKAAQMHTVPVSIGQASGVARETVQGKVKNDGGESG